MSETTRQHHLAIQGVPLPLRLSSLIELHTSEKRIAARTDSERARAVRSCIIRSGAINHMVRGAAMSRAIEAVTELESSPASIQTLRYISEGTLEPGDLPQEMLEDMAVSIHPTRAEAHDALRGEPARGYQYVAPAHLRLVASA